MSRAKTQTTGFGRPLGPRNTPAQTQRARELLARSRGVTVAERPLKPPARRNWFLHAINRAENCNECGRVIEPNADRYLDTVSGHLVRHLECHEKAEAKR